MSNLKMYLSDEHDFIKSKLVLNRVNEVIAPMGSGKTILIKEMLNDTYYTSKYDRVIVGSPFSVSRTDYEQVAKYQSYAVKSTIYDKSFTYYTNLVKDLVKFFVNHTKNIDRSFLKSEDEFENQLKLATKEYIANVPKTLFIFDEYDFAFTQLTCSRVLSRTFVSRLQNKQANLNFGLVSDTETTDKNTLVSYLTIFKILLTELLNSGHGVITFSANYSYFKTESITNLILISTVSSPIKYNTFNVEYTNKLGTEYFADLIKQTVNKATRSSSKTLIFVPYIYLYTMTGLIDGLNKDRKTLLLYRGENIHELASPKLNERFTRLDSVLHPTSNFNFVDIDELSDKNNVLDNYSNGKQGLFDLYDTIIVGVSHTRQASLFFSEDDKSNRPKIIAISGADKPFVSSSIMQASGRFRTGRPDVTILFKVKESDEKYCAIDTVDHIVKNIDVNFDKYTDKNTKIEFMDVTESQKGLYKGRSKGKAVSEKTAKMNVIKGTLCKSVYCMLDAGKAVKQIIEDHTGENLIEGLTEKQTVLMIYDCAAGRVPKKFTREQLGL